METNIQEMVRLKKMAKVEEYIPIHYRGKRHPVKVETGDKTNVEQCHRETTNINKIVARYRQSGRLPEGKPGRYEDVSEVGDFLEVRLQMNAALAAYEDLPKSVTDQFKDAGEFVEYAEKQRQALEEKPKETIAETPGESPGKKEEIKPETPETPPAD